MAVVVIMVYGYMLLDFFLSEVKGMLFGFLVCFCAIAWIGFIIYLVRHGGAFPSILAKSPKEGFSLAPN